MIDTFTIREVWSHKMNYKALYDDSKNFGIQLAFGQRPRSFQQNNLLKNRLMNLERPEKLGLENLSTERFVDWENIKV